MDAAEQDLLAESLRKMMTGSSGHELDTALAGLGWSELLAEEPDIAIPLVFGLLGQTGASAPLLNDVLLRALGRPLGGTVPLPYTGGSWLVWDRIDHPGTTLDEELPLRPVTGGQPLPLAAGRRALGWWLIGSSRAMLALARAHVLDRTQFGRPLAGFQAVRHRLAETLVAIEGAEAALVGAVADTDLAAGGLDADAGADLAALLAKAAAGRAALTTARHCQQVLGGIGFTAEHDLQRHVRRVLVLDGLLGSARELTREAGALIRARGSAPRLIQL